MLRMNCLVREKKEKSKGVGEAENGIKCGKFPQGCGNVPHDALTFSVGKLSCSIFTSYSVKKPLSCGIFTTCSGKNRCRAVF